MKTMQFDAAGYKKTLKERSRQSHVYRRHQMTALSLVEILRDRPHKSLYFRLAKLYDEGALIRLAKNIAERKNVQNPGAYFMKLLHNLPKKPNVREPSKKQTRKNRQGTLFKFLKGKSRKLKPRR